MASTSRRVACNCCRERKVRCDGVLPSCLACEKRGVECVYAVCKGQDANNEELVGTIKALTLQLARAENEIAEQKGKATHPSIPSLDLNLPSSTSKAPLGIEKVSYGMSTPSNDLQTSLQEKGYSLDLYRTLSSATSASGKEIVDLISQGVVAGLHESFFNCFHAQFPLLNQKRYLLTWRSKLDNEGGRALVHAIWMHGASFSATTASLQVQLYVKCRQCLEHVEAGASANLMTIEVVQASLLLALYEFKHMHFARAWLSHARALRLVRMLRLHRLDSAPNTSQGKIFDKADCVERRQTFWVAFMLDRLSNAGTDWPVTFEESELLTLLPLQESADGNAENMLCIPHSASLADIMNATTPQQFSPFAGMVIMVSMWGRCVAHLYACRPGNDTLSEDFWARHYELDATIIHIFNSCCGHSAHQGTPLKDSNTLFIHLLFQTIVIYLHQAAVAQAKIFGLPFGESDERCRRAAMEIAAIVRTSSGSDVMNWMNLFAARSLHAAARVLTQTIKELSGDARIFETLHYLVSDISAYQASNPLVELYLKHILAELENNEIPYPSLIPR